VISRLLRPWTSPRTVRALAQTALDLPFGIVNFTVTVVLLAVSAGLLITFPLALPFAWLLFVCAAGLGRVARSRLAASCDVDLPDPHPPLRSTSWFRRLWERAKTPSRWREVLYLVASLPLGVAAFVATVVAWAGSLALVALPAYVSSLPGGTAEFGIFDVGSGPAAWALALVGLVGLLVGAPWLTIAMANADGALAQRLLAPPRTERLEAEVARLDRSRVAALDSAEAERRRIERDLHDGAQQRLVKLGMDLGMAHDRFDTDPDGARQLVADAHGEAKAALVELRDLVRGFHPAILEDRGLDAALSAVIARSPVPVTLRVEVRERPPAAVESAAYFIVVETLTNVAKHAGATKASVTIERRGDRLAIDVTDDGRGGATTDDGSGLHGLEERVRALGGWMQVLSPAGGPTSVLAELPCGS
jgi:signal transduction histidine kinase